MSKKQKQQAQDKQGSQGTQCANGQTQCDTNPKAGNKKEHNK